MRHSSWVAGAVALLAALGESAHVVTSHGGQNVAASQRGASRRLRICNAFPFESGVDIYHLPYHPTSALAPNWHETGETQDMLTEKTGPVLYKKCIDFGEVEGLGTGSLINFRFSGGLLLGGFQVKEATAPGSLLQIVVFRYDSQTTTADFSSHVFSPAHGYRSDPEIVLLDTYRRPGNAGSGGAKLELYERGIFSSGKDRHEHITEWGRVVTVRPGTYEWVMLAEGRTLPVYGVGYRPNYAPPQEKIGSCSTWLQAGGHYTVIRVGNDAKVGPTYPEEVISFPDTWAQCDSAMGGCQVSAVTAMTVMLAWLTATSPS